MFSRGEKVVYPGHGVAKINRIIEKKIAGSIANFFELKFLNKDMTILVPVNNATSVGVRRLSSKERIETLFKMLSQPINSGYQNEVMATNWNKRNKEYQGKLRTGDLQEICEIYRDLKHIELQKELSFGEKTLLHQTEVLLVEEISIVRNIPKAEATACLRSLVSNLQPEKSKMVHLA